MSANTTTTRIETLPDPLPANPLQVAAEWLEQARRDALQPNPNAMVLASVDSRGQPSARVVLCKEIAAATGSIIFYTNYESRKGRELDENPRAAVVFHWDHRHRQVRAEGLVARLSDTENDEYFASRAWQSRLGAWASRQSEPVASRSMLIDAVQGAAQRFGIRYAGPDGFEPDVVSANIPRPSNWGGYRLVAEAVELWVEGEFRIHDRARWTRASDPRHGTGPGHGTDARGGGTGQAAWSATRLQP